MTDEKVSYVVDWRKDQLEVVEVTKDSALQDRLAEVECTISLTEDTLMSISSGNLNPQVALLSDKIAVDGKMEVAMYAFNLLRMGGGR